jgi:hypothetical protein
MSDSTLPASAHVTPTVPEMTFTLTGVESAPSTYADGISQVALGYPVSRVFLFHSTMPSSSAGAQKEARKITQILLIPTVQLVEACKNILGLAKALEAQLGQLNGVQSGQLTSLLSDVVPRMPEPVRQEE